MGVLHSVFYKYYYITDFTTRAFPTTSKQTTITTFRTSATSKDDIASPTTYEINSTTDYSYDNTTPRGGSPGQEEETTTDNAIGQEAHTSCCRTPHHRGYRMGTQHHC